MKCPKCNSVVPEGVIFCTECGFKTDNAPVCKDCGAPLKDGILFCPSCHTPSRNSYASGEVAKIKTAPDASSKMEDELEKTMTIPVVKPGMRKTPEGDKSPRKIPVEKERKPLFKEDAPKINKSVPAKDGNGFRLNSRQKNILIFIIVFLFVVMVGLLVIIGIINASYKKVVETDVYRNDEIIEKESESKTSDKKQSSESTGVSETGSSRHIEVYDPLIDFEYKFVRGIHPDDIVAVLESGKRGNYESYEHSLECSIPSGFRHESDGEVEVRYVAKNGTAYMDIGAMNNTSSWTVDDVREATVSQLGGTVDTETSGDGWFVVSVIKDEVCYYRKCFVNEKSICYLEMVYPEEYEDAYSSCMTLIDEGFRQTQ